MIKNQSFIYNIIQYQEKSTLFFFCVLFIAMLLIFSNIKISLSILFGFILYLLIINYLSYKNDKIIINEEEKLNIKKNKYNIPKKHEKIIDFLFNLEDLKQFSFIIFNNIETLLNNFVITYDNCLNDYTLVNDYYVVLNNLKLKTLKEIENFNLNGSPKNIVMENKKMIENILDEYLNNLILINNKNNYYNGYDVYSKVIEKTNIEASNLFDYENEYRGNILSFNLQNYNFI